MSNNPFTNAASNNPYHTANKVTPVAQAPASNNPYHNARHNPAIRSGSTSSITSKASGPLRSSSFASDLGLYTPTRALSLKAPKGDPFLLTPLRAHYLKRELVTLEFQTELTALESPASLSLLGPPFLPRSRFVNGIPGPAPPSNSLAALEEQNTNEANIDLPFLRFIFHHFILSFPFLASCPPTFFSHKLQPFVYSFVSRNISNSDERDSDTKRKRIAGKVEKHLGLIVSAAIKLSDNEGREEVVRIEDDDVNLGTWHTGAPATQERRPSEANPSAVATKGKVPQLFPTSPNPSRSGTADGDAEFSINVVSVRNVVVKGRVRNKVHEEFIIRTRRKGDDDVIVARRYGDFVRLAETLRKECVEQDVRPPPAKDRRSVEARSSNSPQAASPRTSLDYSGSSPSTDSPAIGGVATPPVFDTANLPSLARERNRLTLRAYLRSILTNPILASSMAFQSFLIESPLTLNTSEMRDVEVREEMDRLRDAELFSFRREVDARVEELESYLREFKEDLVNEDGLSRVFSTIRETENVEDLPVKYRKVLEWGRISLASTIYQLFLGSDNSSSVFAQLKRMHGIMPYFMLRGILRISNPVAMVRAVLDLFLARPFGSTSLLQKMFSSGLDAEAKELREDAELVAKKIGDERLVEKVKNFVNAPKLKQDQYRSDAAAENLDILSVILRSDEDPQLDRATMQQVRRSSVAYEEYKHHRNELSDPEDDEGPDNDDAWLFEDLHVLMRITTKARDKEQLMELIFEGSTSELLKDIVTIFYEPLAKVYKAANIADSLSDLQVFLNDLIKTVELAEEANLVEPQKTVQIFVDLVTRHESRFYSFVHQVHSKGEGLFDNLMKWLELFINFVRDGMPTHVSLESLLPAGGKDRKDLLAEVDAIVEYHRKLKAAHHERMQKRIMKGQRKEADVDAAFVNGVMENLHIGAVMGDVDDVANEDSDQEYSSENEEVVSSDDEVVHSEKSPTGSTLQPIPNKKKKDREILVPPVLKRIPALVPVFVELLRGELKAAMQSSTFSNKTWT